MLAANSLYVNTFNTMIHDSSTPPGKHAPNYFEPCTPSSGCQWTLINTLMFDVLRSDTQLRQGNMFPIILNHAHRAAAANGTSINTLMFDVLRSDTPIVSTEPVLTFGV
jgi:hypothetical protein